MSITTTRTLDYQSSKFWEVTQNGNVVRVRYGKTGTQGQTQDKRFDDAAAANKHTAKLIAEKVGKGYVERGGATPVPAGKSTSVVTESTSISAEATKVSNKAAPAKAVSASKATKAEKPKAPLQDPEATPVSLLSLLDKDDATNRLLAKHPNASAELLEKLSHSSDKATRQGVAGNPNTAPEVYVKLGQQFPKEFLANPALDLLLMINPGLMEEVPQALLIRLLKQADCPASLLIWAACHPEAKVQLAVAMNAKAPEQAKEKLRASQHAAVREAVSAPKNSIDQTQDPEAAFEQALRDRLSSMKYGELQEAWSEGDIGLAQWTALPLAFRLAKATNSDGFSPEAIKRILADTGWTVEGIRNVLPGYEYWSELALDLQVSQAFLEQLAKHTDCDVRFALVQKSSTPVSVLEMLSRDQDDFIRCSVAANPSTPAAVLDALASDGETNVRRNVGKHPNTPLAVLEILAADKVGDVRQAVAMHLSAPSTVLEKLAKDQDSGVLQAVAENPSTPLHLKATLLEALAKDQDLYARRNVAQHLATPVAVLEVLARDKESFVRREVAKHPSTPVAVLEVLARDKEIDTRREVAKHANTPVAVLETLAGDEKSDFWREIVKSPTTPIAVLQVLAKDQNSSWVRGLVAGNPSTPEAVLEDLARDKESSVRQEVAENPSTPEAVLEGLGKDQDIWVLQAVAENPSTPLHLKATLLEALAKDKVSTVRADIASRVRAAVAANSATPAELLAKLASDKVGEVAMAALGNPNTPMAVLLPSTKAKSSRVRCVLARHAHRSEEICSILSKDPDANVRQAVIRNQELASSVLDELTRTVETENDFVELLAHPNLSAQSAQLLADKLLKTPAVDRPWYQHELSKAKAEVAAAAQAQAVLSYFGKDPNKVVLAKRPLAAIMALCAGPFVEPSRIVKVAGSTDWLVRAAVARNSGTPPNLLKKLAADAHPLVALVARATTRSTENIPAQDLAPSEANIDLLRATKEVVRRIPVADNRENTALSNQFFTDDVWAQQLNVGQIAWMTVLAQNPLTVQMQRMLDPKQAALMFELAVTYERASESLGSFVRRWVASEPSCPINVLRDLANDEDPDVVLATLGNIALPQEEKEVTQTRLERYRGKQLLALLWNAAAPSEVLVAKSTSKDRNVRQSVAKNPSAPAATLEVLAKDTDLWVRLCVAENPSAPVAVLEALAKDKESGVRIRVANNPSIPVGILEELAEDKDISVRSRVGRNPATPAVVLNALAKDSEHSVRGSVAENPSTPVPVLEELAKDSEEWVRRRVAQNPFTPMAILEAFAIGSGADIRALVAVNASAPVAVLEELAKETDSTIRLCVARNPNTPLPVLRDLAEDESLEVSGSVALRGGQHPEFLDRFIVWWHSRLQRALDRESRLRAGEVPEPVAHVQPDDLLRALYRLGLISPTDDNKALTQASRSKDWLTRLGAALHPGASEGILKLLRKDADPDVAKAASRRAAGSTTAA